MSPVGNILDRLRGEGLAAHLLRGVAGTGGLGIASKLLSLLSAIVLGRSLGSEGYGYYAFALAVVAFIAIPAQLGLPQLILREVAAHHARSEWALLRGLRQRSVEISTVATLVGGVLGGGAVFLLADRIAALDPVAFGIALLLLPLQVGLAITGTILVGLRRMVRGTWPANLLQPALFCVLLVVLVSGMTPARAVALNLICTATGFAVTLWLLRRYWPREATQITPEFRTREWIGSLLPFTLLAGIALFSQKMDVLLLGWMTSASDVGIYNVALQGALLVSFPLTISHAVLAPNVARLHAQGDLVRLQRLVTLSTLAIALAAAAGAAVLLLTGEWLLANLFGKAFAGGYTALLILTIGQLFSACAGAIGLFLTMTGHEKDTLRAVGLSAVLNLVLNLVLIPPYGIVGAAIATAVSQIVWNIVGGLLLYRRLGLVGGPFGRWRATTEQVDDR
jgi:O-antigen/teichoic acid export membrane protein